MRQQPSDVCFSYSKTPEPASALVLAESSPLQLFSQFFTGEVFDLLVVETSHYAATACGASSHAHPWTAVTVQERKTFGEFFSAWTLLSASVGALLGHQIPPEYPWCL